MSVTTMELTVIDHQDVHLNGQQGKTQWAKGVTRKSLDPFLKELVQSKEAELRNIFASINVGKSKLQMITTFYIVKSLDKNQIRTYCQGDVDGVCIEVAISSVPGNTVIKADIHGYPVNVNKEGIATAITQLCNSR